MDINPKQPKTKDQIESKKHKKNKQKKVKHENLMKQLPPTCFSCLAHEDDYLRIIPRPPKNPPTCKSCGFKLQGKYGYLCCAKSNSCFQLCSTCRICTKSHILRNIISLNPFTENELYSQNKFKCHGCKQQKEVNADKGVFHCNPCSFSICVECIQRTDKLWQSIEPQIEE